MVAMTPCRIAILGYDGANALDITGPAEAFDSAPPGPGGRRYEVLLLGLTRKPFRTESGLVFQPAAAAPNAGPVDTIIIPGGVGIREPGLASRVAAWIRAEEPRTRRVVSVCTGIYGLAATNLLNGRRVTTHWRFARDVASRFPNLIVDPAPLFIRAGKFYTSAGVTAGIDLALALIEEDLGRRAALVAARDLVVYLKRPGGQDQFSEPLQFQVQAADGFNEIASWIASNLHQDLSVEALARRASLCPRHFRRRFRSVFGKNPASYIEGLRLGEARRRLATTRQTVGTVASSVGVGSADVLRRAFLRRFGLSPTDYRERFYSSRRLPGAEQVA